MHIKSRAAGNALQAWFSMELSPSAPITFKLKLSLVRGNCRKWYHKEVLPNFHPFYGKLGWVLK